MTNVEPYYLSTIPYGNRKLSGQRESVCFSSEESADHGVLQRAPGIKVPDVPTTKSAALDLVFILCIPFFVFLASILRTILLEQDMLTRFVDTRQSRIVSTNSVLDMLTLSNASLALWERNTSAQYFSGLCRVFSLVNNLVAQPKGLEDFCIDAYQTCFIHVRLFAIREAISDLEPMLNQVPHLLSFAHTTAQNFTQESYQCSAGELRCGNISDNFTLRTNLTVSMGTPCISTEVTNLWRSRMEDGRSEVSHDLHMKIVSRCLTLAFLVVLVLVISTLSLCITWKCVRRIGRLPGRFQKLCKNLDIRYEQVLEERYQSEQLLFQMLPVSVARKLIAGVTVEAETFEQVSVYFSDIVGFNDAALSVSPIQIVNLLNSIYGCVH